MNISNLQHYSWEYGLLFCVVKLNSCATNTLQFFRVPNCYSSKLLQIQGKWYKNRTLKTHLILHPFSFVSSSLPAKRFLPALFSKNDLSHWMPFYNHFCSTLQTRRWHAFPWTPIHGLFWMLWVILDMLAVSPVYIHSWKPTICQRWTLPKHTWTKTLWLQLKM